MDLETDGRSTPKRPAWIAGRHQAITGRGLDWSLRACSLRVRGRASSARGRRFDICQAHSPSESPAAVAAMTTFVGSSTRPSVREPWPRMSATAADVPVSSRSALDRIRSRTPTLGRAARQSGRLPRRPRPRRGLTRRRVQVLAQVDDVARPLAEPDAVGCSREGRRLPAWEELIVEAQSPLAPGSSCPRCCPARSARKWGTTRPLRFERIACAGRSPPG